ncbi:hypothetical protein HY407_03645 [Candidatus Gottesmanbacteria bacterium]|nr:hypothetical protein [Candidatus Gottesmanbacteria bacterium]
MREPTPRQVARARSLGIDLSQCRNAVEAERAIEIALRKLSYAKAQKLGVVPGVRVRKHGKEGIVRFLYKPEESPDEMIVGVDWEKPKKQFSRVSTKDLEVVK